MPNIPIIHCPGYQKQWTQQKLKLIKTNHTKQLVRNINQYEQWVWKTFSNHMKSMVVNETLQSHASNQSRATEKSPWCKQQASKCQVNFLLNQRIQSKLDDFIVDLKVLCCYPVSKVILLGDSIYSMIGKRLGCNLAFWDSGKLLCKCKGSECTPSLNK